MNIDNQFLTKIVPACLATLGKDGLVASGDEFEVSLREVIKKMDNTEFNVFLAQVVIKASSGQEVVGAQLSAGVVWLKELRVS